jgi:4-amino-4-deoxy-L-arabinose transferase-like glycosyltransferase
MTVTADRAVRPGPLAPEPDPAAPESLARRLLRGRTDDPAWARPALLTLLLSTAVLYLWGLSESGWANSFYSAAVQAGSESWKAFFYGSSDASNSITVDKTPASLWVMALSVRAFGLSSWSILAPQALEGVAAVALLYLTVRRWFTPAAGLIAGATLALTPVATLMFRFNNPDALLVLLLVGSVYATVRALEAAATRAGTRWLALAGVLVGLGFLTKMLQAFLVVPVLALVYLVCAPTSLRRRIVQTLLSGLALVATAGWWLAIVELVPASMRPYIGGSQNNSILELTLGYNGLGRLTGDETGSVGGGGGNGGGMWGTTGITRLFDAENGGQASWLVPAALVLFAAALWLTRRMPRTDRTRAAFLLWGGWLLVTGLVFSFMGGIFHAYYAVALAPAIGGLVGMGAAVLWKVRRTAFGALTMAGTVAVSSVWSFVLLSRSADFVPWLRYAVLVAGLVSAVLLVLPVLGVRFAQRAVLGAAALGVVASLAGPAAYSLQTASTGHSGSIVTAGPTVAGGRGFGPGGNGGGPGGMGAPPGMQNGTGTTGTTGRMQGGPGGGMGGLLNSTTPSTELQALLMTDADSYTWVAAAVGSQNASGYQLATQEPVMAIGGFNGSDPSPTLEQFKAYVAEGKIHYFVGGGGMGGQSMGGSSSSSEIAAWVQENFTAQTVGGVTVYDLTAGASTT